MPPILPAIKMNAANITLFCSILGGVIYCVYMGGGSEARIIASNQETARAVQALAADFVHYTADNSADAREFDKRLREVEMAFSASVRRQDR